MKPYGLNMIWLATFLIASLFINSVGDKRTGELIQDTVTPLSLPYFSLRDSRNQVSVLAAFNQSPMSFEPNRLAR